MASSLSCLRVSSSLRRGSIVVRMRSLNLVMASRMRVVVSSLARRISSLRRCSVSANFLSNFISKFCKSCFVAVFEVSFCFMLYTL